MPEKKTDEKPEHIWKAKNQGRISTEGGVYKTPPRTPSLESGPIDLTRPVERREMEERIERLSSEMANLRQTLRSLTRFRTIIDQADEAIFVIDPDTDRFVDANQTALRWLGRSHEQLLSLTIHDVDVEFPLRYPKSDAIVAAGARGHARPWVCGRLHRRRDGTYFPVEVAVAKRRFADRTYTLVVARENKQHRRAEQIRREIEAVTRLEHKEKEQRIGKLSGEVESLKRTMESLARFRTIIDHVDEAIFVIDPETDRFVDANETAIRWLDLAREQLLSLSIHDVDVEFPLGYPRSVTNVEKEARSVMRPWVCDGRHKRRDGSHFPVEVAVAQRRFADRTYTLVVARESRQRHQVENVLREVEDRYKTLFELTQDAVYVTARDGRITDVNEAAIELFGYARGELLELRTRDLYAGAPDAQSFEDNVQQHGFVRDLPVRLRSKDGSVIPGFLTATPRRNSDGNIEGYQCFIRPQPGDAASVDTEPPEFDETSVSGNGKHGSKNVKNGLGEGVDADDLVGSWIQYEQMKAAGGPVKPSIGELLEAGRETGDQWSPERPEIREVPATVESGLPSETTEAERTPHMSRRAAESKTGGPSSGVEISVRTRRRRRTTPRKPSAEKRDFNPWLLMLVVGVVMIAVGWTELVRLIYGFNVGIREWQLGVRVLGPVLLALGLAGRYWRLTARGVAAAVLLLALALLATYADFLRNFPFELKDVAPSTTEALDYAILQASGFTAALVVFCGWVAWRLWTDVEPDRDPGELAPSRLVR